MKRLSALLSKPSKRGLSNDSQDSPEQRAMKGVRLFCESGTPSNSMQRGEEVTILPSIVEAAESSPQAAAAAASHLRKFLSKDHYAYPYRQYNAIMLVRILADNPGKGFTRYIDEKFKETVKWLLKMSRDPSVQQITRETLDAFERDKKDDENLKPLLKMYEKEKKTVPQMQHGGDPSYQGRGLYQTNWQEQNQRKFHSDGRPKHSLPNPEELAARIEEARTSAKLLIQLVQTTPAGEVGNNDLIKEFAERCQSAQRSLHAYMSCTDPAPDEPTFQTLIETNEQLSLAGSKHQRALLAGRRQNSQQSSALQNAEQLSNGSNVASQAALARTLPPSPNSHLGYSPQPTTVKTANPNTQPQLSNETRHRQQLHPAFTNASSAMQANPFSDSNHVRAPSPGQPSTSQYGDSHSVSQPPPAQAQNRYYNYPERSYPPGNQNEYSAQPIGAAQYPRNQYSLPTGSPPPPARSPRRMGTGERPAELSGVTTPPQTSEAFSRPRSDEAAHISPSAGPPPGPPPGHGRIPSIQVPGAGHHDEDLYTTSPMASRGRTVSAVSSADNRPSSSGLYSIGSEAQKHEPDQHIYGNNAADRPTPLSTEALRNHNNDSSMNRRPMWGEAETPVVESLMQNGTCSVPRRVKDDEPMTPTLGVSGAGWQY